ncbi:MAG: AraC family transcriptional regulator, partial [Spirochaetia bacterium]|nr:AraC family transcriptional regulator [Spirochaetia bacterium]
ALYLLVQLGRIYSKEVIFKSEDNLTSYHLSSLTRALTYIDNNFTQPLRIEEIAKQAYLSPSYFCYVFKQLTHRTIVQYMSEKRVEMMCRLLTSTATPIATISYLSGFSTTTHANRVFKERLGISPREYRKSYTSQ